MELETAKSSTIKPLPQSVVNQISAGEVVERPANMVKELIENSIDAKASQIEIQFSQGGRSVKITDNGQGIYKTDLECALKNHHTSKINNLKDLWSLNSYGFRGEALASIAEVSDLTLLSKPPGQNKGYKIKSRFGKLSTIEETECLNGTCIIVEDLFACVPARLQFLKTPASESLLIKNVIKAMVLGRPGIEFRVLHKDRLLFFWKAQDLKTRAKDILGIKQAFTHQHESYGIKAEVVLAPPNETCKNRKHMWFFVNNRWVEDTTLMAAVLQAFRSLLMHKEFPYIVLKIWTKGEDIDINAHPAKSKVRFKDNARVFRCVHSAVRSLLETAPWLAVEEKPSSAGPLLSRQNPATPPIQSSLKEDKELFKTPGAPSLTDKVLSSFNKKTNPGPKTFFSPPVKDNTTSFGSGKSTFKSPHTSDKKDTSLFSPSIEDLKNLGGGGVSPGRTGREASDFDEEKTALLSETEFSKKGFWSSLHVLCQTHLTYIICQSPKEIVFIDQHAAHERILYEILMKQWTTPKTTQIQNRLIPLVLDFNEPMVEALCSVEKDLKNLGFSIEKKGADSLLIKSSPNIVKDLGLQKAFFLLRGTGDDPGKRICNGGVYWRNLCKPGLSFGYTGGKGFKLK